MTGRHLRACGHEAAGPEDPGGRPAGACTPGDDRGASGASAAGPGGRIAEDRAPGGDRGPGAGTAAGVIPAELVAGYRAAWGQVAVALREAITSGAIPPGARIDGAVTARELGVPDRSVARALRALAGEQLVTRRGSRWHAAPAGPPDPAASARLGRLLAGTRAAARMDAVQLAEASLTPDDRGFPELVAQRAALIGAAEAGEWQPRELWSDCDAALGADGSLLRIHDNLYTPAARLSGQREPRSSGPAAAAAVITAGPSGGYEKLLDRVADAVREEITTGIIPPGTRLDCRDIARRHGLAGTGHLVSSALARLNAEGIIYCHHSRRYAAPAGQPGPAATAALGAELRRRREEAGLTPEELAAAPRALPPAWGVFCAHRAGEIRLAESGAWHDRGFWAELDAALSAGGGLLKLHDRLYRPAVKPTVPRAPAPSARSAPGATARANDSQPPGSDRTGARARAPSPAAVAR